MTYNSQEIIQDPFHSEQHGLKTTSFRCKCFVLSHQTNNPYAGKINCTLDIIQCDLSKTIKGGGQANFVLVPRKNYLNLIFPNDHVHIYFDPGDGRGYIRTFFGFVDRISRTIKTDNSTGATTTRFIVSCTDFTKIFDKVMIYFNPRIARREDLVGNYIGTANLGGVALRVKGVAVSGSPADIVLSLTQLILGFGAQFILPPSYIPHIDYVNKNRKFRLDWARNNLPDSIRETLDRNESTVTLLNDLLEKEANEVAKMNFNYSYDEDYTPSYSEKEESKRIVLEKYGLPVYLFDTQYWRAALEIESSASQGAPFNILDLIDFRYVERDAIDGYISSASIWQSEGSLWSIMNSWSNEVVNELFCDLRPMAPEPSSATSAGKESKELNETAYGTEPDDLEENEGAVRFAPCLVMREYPFGTIDGILPDTNLLIIDKMLPYIPYGALFSRQANIPGRKVIEVPIVHPAEYNKALLEGTLGRTFRHLDVAVISVQDIIEENIGRSDADHVNLIEVVGDVSAGRVMNSKLITQEVQPITTGIQIARHGLRVRSFTTRFCNFSAEQRFVSEDDAAAYLARLKGTTSDDIKENSKDMLSGLLGGVVDIFHNRRLLIRYALLMDHWYQHNLEYLHGTVATRGLPEIRVGYRLDILERRESYYVEAVNHTWSYPGTMMSTFSLSRGQRNDNYPVYTPPAVAGLGGNRSDQTRLSECFLVKDTTATTRSILSFGDGVGDYEEDGNFVDDPYNKNWAKFKTYAANTVDLTIEEKKNIAFENKQRGIGNVFHEVLKDNPFFQYLDDTVK